MTNESLLLVGRVGRSFGVKGYCRLIQYSGNPRRFIDDIGCTFILKSPRARLAGEVHRCQLEGIKEQDQALLLKWKGIDSPEEVKKFSGWDIYWDGSDDWVPDESGEIRIDQLIGLAVIDCETLVRVGMVSDFYERSGQDLLSIKTSNGEVLCPFVEYLVPHVNMSDGEVHVRWSVVGTSV